MSTFDELIMPAIRALPGTFTSDELYKKVYPGDDIYVWEKRNKIMRKMKSYVRYGYVEIAAVETTHTGNITHVIYHFNKLCDPPIC